MTVAETSLDCPKLQYFPRGFLIMFKIVVALVELLWDCSMLILKFTSLIWVLFSDFSSVSSSCMVSSVFSFRCSSVSNSFLWSSVSVGSFSFIFLLTETASFYLFHMLWSCSLYHVYFFDSLFLRTTALSCFCWCFFFSRSYSVLDTGDLFLYFLFHFLLLYYL